MKRLKLAVFSLTSCDGCQVVLLQAFKQLLQLERYIEISHFPLLKDKNKRGPFDISIVEGSVVNKRDIKKIKQIRKKSKILIALGTCATHGGVQAVKNFMPQDKVVHAVYPPGFIKDATEVSGIGRHVKVDYEIWGCPPVAEDIVKLLKKLMVGQKPKNINEEPVCVECRALGHECLLEKGILCLGPITHKGCNAICISAGRGCYGCRGFLNEGNVKQLLKKLTEMGYSIGQIEDILSVYMSNSKKVKRVIEYGENY